MTRVDSYSVQAILTLKDNLSAGLKNAAGATESLGGKFKRAVGLGAAMQIGMGAVSKAVSTMTSHIDSAVSRYDQLNNFPRVMNNLGISSKAASSALKSLDKGITGLPTTLDAATQGVTRFVSKNGDIKKSTDYFLAMNNAVLAGGASVESQGYAVEQLSQAYAKGKMDMEEWRSIQTAMPAQLNQVAKAMGMTADQLGEGLRSGTISMDEFMDTMVKLNKEGVDGFASFEKQALTATGGIKTAFTNMNTAITRGLANCIGAIDEMLKKNDLPTIAEMINKTGDAITKAFKKAEGAIKKVNLRGIIDGLTPAFKVLKGAAEAVWPVLKSVFKWANKNAEGLASLIPLIIAGAGAFKAYKKIKGWLDPASGATKIFDKLGDSSKKATKHTRSLKSALGSLAKMAGVAAVIASLALLAKSLEGIASQGGKAVAPLLGFAAAVSSIAVVLSKVGKKLNKGMKGIIAFSAGVSGMALAMAPLAKTGLEGAAAMGAFGIVVAGLAAVLGGVGPKLQTSIGGIIAFGAAVAAMALAMAPIANAGELASQNMITFGIVVAGLVAVFGLFGGALQGVMVPMLAFGATILMIGVALNLATPFITAFSGLIKQLGNTVTQVVGAIASAVSQIVTVIGGTLCSVMQTAGEVISSVADSISSGFQKICDGIADVINAVSGGFQAILEGIAEVIDSIGRSAKNAGKGFESVANGIKTISGLSLWDIGKSLGAVAVGMGEISTSGKNLPQVAAGMQGIVSAVTLGAGSLTIFNAALTTMSGMITGVVTNVNNLKTAFSNFVITPPNVGPYIAAFATITAAARQLVPSLTSAGIQAGTGLASGLSSGAARARAAVSAVAASIIAVLSTLPARVGTIGRNTGNTFASGLQSGLSKAVKHAQTAVSQINSTLRSASNGAYSAGRNIGMGLANGMRSTLGEVRSVASQLAAAAQKAIEAKAKIASPSKVTTKLGRFFGEGWVNGIADMFGNAKRTASRLVSIPQIKQPEFAMSYSGYSGAASDDYIYGGGGTYIIEVPVNLEGREVSRVVAPYMQSDLNRLETRESRKRGIR